MHRNSVIVINSSTLAPGITSHRNWGRIPCLALLYCVSVRIKTSHHLCFVGFVLASMDGKITLELGLGNRRRLPKTTLKVDIYLI